MTKKKPTVSQQPKPDDTPAPVGAGFVLCDVCGGVLYARDAPRHSTHTRADIIAANRLRREAAVSEAAEQTG